MQIQIINTEDGSSTLFVPELNEYYHSTKGALTESEHVFLKNGYNFHSEKNNIKVLEIGFGTGLNCWLTSLNAMRQVKKTYYYAIEKHPLSKTTISSLNYVKLKSDEEYKIFQKIHLCKWEETVKIHDYFYLTKIKADITSGQFVFPPKNDVIYFDAFGPDKQAEMWTPKIFRGIFDAANDNAVFVTYSAKGEVRRNLTRAGFTMKKIPGPPGKKQMLRGIKSITKL